MEEGCNFRDSKQWTMKAHNTDKFTGIELTPNTAQKPENWSHTLSKDFNVDRAMPFLMYSPADTTYMCSAPGPSRAQSGGMADTPACPVAREGAAFGTPESWNETVCQHFYFLDPEWMRNMKLSSTLVHVSRLIKRLIKGTEDLPLLMMWTVASLSQNSVIFVLHHKCPHNKQAITLGSNLCRAVE